MRLAIPESIDLVDFLGPGDEYLRTVERLHPDVSIFSRGRDVRVTGSPEGTSAVVALLGELKSLVSGGTRLSVELVERADGLLTGAGQSAAEVMGSNILSSRGKSIRSKTLGQHRYTQAIANNTITFGLGPAGTGKTYLAMAMAVQALQRGDVSRIILTRPAVEAGERLGFLPGTLDEKIDPYVRPLYDALHDMIDAESIPKLLEAGIIEVAPLAYMRGRTLNDAFIILDEAQNTTPEQMKMFLTRLGFGSTMVVTGDTTQVDLPGSTVSGLRIVRDILVDIDDVHFEELTSRDVVRHALVTRIVDAYDRFQGGGRS